MTLINILRMLTDLIRTKTKLDDKQIEEVLSYFKSISVKKNMHLLEPGKVSGQLFFIKKGCLRLYYINENHQVLTRIMAFENTFLTSIVSFISREPSTEYIQAIEDSELLVISYDQFTLLRNLIPEWDKMYIHILEYGLTVINSKLSSLLTQNAVERYLTLLKNNPELVQRLSNSNLAAFLNISPETLSRLKSKI